MKQAGLIGRAKSYLKSILSRYLGYGKKAEAAVKKIRSMSCNGVPGELDPCEHREPSEAHPGSYFCGACGCGDRKAVLISGDTPSYEKLDYPFLSCPIHMPGFSNYTPSSRAPKTDLRKVFIESQTSVAYLEEVASEQQKAFRLYRYIESIKKPIGYTRQILRRVRSYLQ